MKIGVWQFLPTGPTAYGDSPYQPLSAFAGNEMLIGLEPLLRQGLLSVEECAGLERLPATHVDYGGLMPFKQALLGHATGRFHTRADSVMKTGFAEFLHRHDQAWLDDYALFRVLKTMHGERPWPEWDPVYARRDRTALDVVQKDQVAAIEQIKILQFLFHQQWRVLQQHADNAGVQLFGDMPIYIALDSADAWAHPEILLIDRDGMPSRVAGVPPDYFSADGQLWGNPLYDWEFHADDGYRWWIQRMQHALDYADLVRVDHFRGFESFWSVTYGAETAREGEWLPGPGHDLFTALKAALGHLNIVAEDLGVITPEVDQLRLAHGIPGMKVLQFEVADPGFDPAHIPVDCVCYTATHDNDTTVGWFNGGNGDTRSAEEILRTRQKLLQLTGGKPETIHLDMIRLALNSPARLAIAPMQDFLGLGSRARLNVPGTTMNNWRWRVRDEQLSPAFCESVARIVEEFSRI